MQLLVLGMHRSGTSATARVLNLMGAYVGAEGSLVGPTEENLKGFWERSDVRLLDDEMLAAAGGSWWRPPPPGFADDLRPSRRRRLEMRAREIVHRLEPFRPWAIKDPRLSLVLPLWRPALELPVALIVYRHPLEVARSLERRDELPIAAGIALWEIYNLSALAASATLPRVLVSYEALGADPVATVRRLREELAGLGIDGLRGARERELLGFIDPALYRQRARPGEDEGLLSPSQQALWGRLRDGSALAAAAPSPTAVVAPLAALEGVAPRRRGDAPRAQDPELLAEDLERHCHNLQTLLDWERGERRRLTTQADRLEAGRERAVQRRRLAEARREYDARWLLLEQNQRDAQRLAAIVEDLGEDVLGVLESRSWAAGDFLVNDLLKRLLRRPNRGLPWAPGRALEALASFRRWREEAHRRWHAATAALPDPGTADAGDPEEGLAALRRSSAPLDEALRSSFAELAQLAGWVEQLDRDLDWILDSWRWRAGRALAAGGPVPRRSRRRLAVLHSRGILWGAEARGRQLLGEGGEWLAPAEG
ncbi:MAG TPA: hypothetical protein VMT16_07355 [Thermoanaerobaculia bacterium]|nr:hypothetical protein [Thermoanaerobaculia bacterium]